MAKQTVLLHGATGETGGDVLEGLLEDGSFEVAVLVRSQSAQKPAVLQLKERGLKVIIGDVQDGADKLAELLAGFDTVISAVAAEGQKDQIVLVDAAAKAGTKRFVPCGFTTISPPGGGVMMLRDQKELVHQRIFYHKLPYTIIDVGFWHQISYPALPSGRTSYVQMMPNTTVYGDGNARNILTDKRDIGRFTARIIKDDRTLNKRVFTHSDVLTQNEIWSIMEEKSGEKIPKTYESYEDCAKKVAGAKAVYEADPTDPMKMTGVVSLEYVVSKYAREDNTPEYAKYLGYLDARELYPDFKPISFAEFIDELLAGKAKRMYAAKYEHLRKK